MHDDQILFRNVAIAPAVDEDAGELLTLQRAAYATEARIYTDPELPALTQTLPELQAELATATALKSTVGHRIVGAVRARVDGTVLHIGRLTVAPDWQGRGIGSRLMTAIESHHGDQVGTAALFTGHLSEANLAMYTRRGYREQRRERLRIHGPMGRLEGDETDRFLHSPGVVLVHLTKPLSATDRPTR